jgi:hypothetical protein
MALFERVQMPSFAGATGWLNSEPLGTAGLRGHVVLANLWTLTCINRLRQEPYLRAWAQAYRDWPALYFVDKDGRIRDQHFGEGRYEQSERVIQRLLGVERELVSVEGRGVEAEANWDHPYTRDLPRLRAQRALRVTGQARAAPSPRPAVACGRVDNRA